MAAHMSVVQRIFRNSGWLLAEKALRLAVGLLVGGWMARHLGPEQFGLYNYSLALVALFSVLANLGLDSVVVRDIVRDPARRDATLGSAFLLKTAGGVLAVSASISASLLLDVADKRVPWLVALLSLTLIAQAFDTVDLWFQSQLQVRFSVVARHAAFLAIATAKILLILSDAPLIAFAWAALGESVLAAITLVVAYRLNRYRLMAWRAELARMHELLAQCWPLFLSGVMIAIYMRVDQVMLGQLAGSTAVGTYSAAIILSELWYAIPLAIVASTAPLLAEARNADRAAYRRLLTMLLRWLTLASCAFAILVSLMSKPLVVLVFGGAYRDSGAILAVHVWTAVFVALGTASSQYLLHENLTRISLQRTLAGVTVNILLNLLWIPRYGPIGAAWAAVVAHAVASLFLFQSPASRACLRLMLRALWPFPGRSV